MSTNVFAACMSVHHIYAWCWLRPEDSIKLPRAGDTRGGEPPWKCRESDPGPLQEQQVISHTERSPPFLNLVVLTSGLQLLQPGLCDPSFSSCYSPPQIPCSGPVRVLASFPYVVFTSFLSGKPWLCSSPVIQHYNIVP